jgi:hypothetical protein
MSEWLSKAEADRMVDEAMSALDRERGKLAELGKVWSEDITIRAKDQSMVMTFDGRGEPTDIAFQGAKYRTMPPAQLANTILETLRRGREEAMNRVHEVMGESKSGFDITGLTSGRIDPLEMVNELMGPMMRGFDDMADQIFQAPAKERKSDG